VAFWDWLTGRGQAVRVAEDVIWMNQGAKARGLVRDVEGQNGRGRFVIVVAHFPATLARVKETLQAQGLPYRESGERLPAADVLPQAEQGGSPRPLLALTEALIPEQHPDPVGADAAAIHVVVAERHFLSADDDRTVAFARGLARRCRITFHLCLDDPLMRAFAGEWVGGVLSRLGMTEDQPIRSALVARRVRGAQGRFAGRGVEDREADSAEEWLRLNAPGRAG
jgi:preprotein translocase subunit SecA